MRRIAPLLGLAIVLAGCGSSAARIEVAPRPASVFKGGAVTPPIKAPPISLHDDAGRPVTLAAQKGRYVLVTFLYVNCPDVCPLIAANLNSTLRQLGPDASKVRVLAVSVDPKGDTPAAVKAYVQDKHLLPQFRYLIGTRAELRQAWAAWHVLSVADKKGLVTHVAYTTLVDPTGKERVLYGSNVHANDVLHDLRVLMRKPAA